MQALAHETAVPEEPKPEPQTTPQGTMIQVPPQSYVQQQAQPVPTETPKTTPVEPTHSQDASTQYENSSLQPSAPIQNPQASAPVKSSQPYAPAPQMIYSEQPIVPAAMLVEMPEYMTCPHCNQHTRVILEEKTSPETWITGLLVCVVCPILAWVPFATKFAYDKTWRCSNCGTKLGSQTRKAPIVVTPVVRTPPPQTIASPQPRRPSEPQYRGKAQY